MRQRAYGDGSVDLVPCVMSSHANLKGNLAARAPVLPLHATNGNRAG